MVISEITTFFTDIINTFTILSLIDILIMTVIIYAIIVLIRNTQAEQVAKGIIMIIIITQVSDWLGLVTVNYVFKNIMTVGFIALLIMFQPELRRALETIGGTKVKSIGTMFKQRNKDETEKFIEEVVGSVNALSKTRTGAIIVIEGSISLEDIVRTGTELDSMYSSELINNIFYQNTPLHDGAVIIGKDTHKIRAAGCLLPLSQNKNVSSALGTRHRAALGVSENSDCLALIVSEETGVISYALGGKLSRFIDDNGLRRILKEILIDNESVPVVNIKRPGGKRDDK